MRWRMWVWCLVVLVALWAPAMAQQPPAAECTPLTVLSSTDWTFSPDGSLLAASYTRGTGTSGEVHIRETATGRLLQAIPRETPPRKYISVDVLISADNTTLAQYYSTDEEKLTVSVWTIATGARRGGFVAQKLANTRNNTDRPEKQFLTPDGAQFIIISPAGVRTFDTATGALVKTLEAGETPYREYDLSPDGTLLALATVLPRKLNDQGLPVGPEKYEVKVLNRATGEVKATYVVEQFDGLSFGPDSRTLAVLCRTGDMPNDQYLYTLHNLQTGEREESRLNVRNRPYGSRGWLVHTVSPDEQQRQIDYLETRTGRVLLANGGSGQLSADGRYLLTRSALWDLARGGVLWSINTQTAPVTALAFSPDGASLTAGGGRLFMQWFNMAEGAFRMRYTPPDIDYRGFAFSGDQTLLACGNDEQVLVLDVVGQQLKQTLPLKERRLERCAFPPNGQQLITITRDADKVQRFMLWDLEKGEALMDVKSADILAVVPWGDERTVLAGNPGVISVWDIIARKSLGGQHSNVTPTNVALSSDRAYLAIGGQQAVSILRTADQAVHKLIDLTEGKQGLSEDWSRQVTALAFSPDGVYLLIGLRSGEIRFLSMATLTVAGSLTGEVGVTALAFSPDGKWLASGDARGGVTLWSLRTGKRHLTWHLIPANPDDPGVVDWVITTPEGYFDCTPDMLPWIAARRKGKLVPIEEYAKTYRNAEKLKVAVAGN